MSVTRAMSPVAEIPRILNELRQRRTDGVLSVYLDTSPSRTIGNGVVIAFRDVCKAIKAHQEGKEKGQESRLHAAIDDVESFLSALSSPGGPGLAIFATGRDNDLLATALPDSPRDAVVWSARAVIEPLVMALDEHERIAVLLLDKRTSRFFTVFLGEIEESRIVVDDVPGKQDTGGWFALSQKRYERHHEELVLQHVKRTIGVISEELERHPFDRLIVGGPDEAISLLISHLPRSLEQRLAGTLSLPLYATDAEVLDAVLIVAEAMERGEENASVTSILEAAHTPHVTIGLESTLGALAEGRVHRLVIAADLDLDGARCDNCGRLTAIFTQCPTCTQSVRPVVSLKEGAIEEAGAKGASIEIVSGEASRRLMELGGLAAVTRY